MVLPNFKIDKNIEANVNQQLENQPMPETKLPPSLQPERPLEIGEIQPSSAEAMAGKKENIKIKNEKEPLDFAQDKQKLKRQKPKNIPQVRDEITVQVEKIMEAGLQDAFKEMSPVQRQEFKIKGEKTAMEIRGLLSASKIKIKKIIKLLISWLRLLPGVNKFFLEQEAKIKADKIISLKNFDKR